MSVSQGAKLIASVVSCSHAVEPAFGTAEQATVTVCIVVVMFDFGAVFGNAYQPFTRIITIHIGVSTGIRQGLGFTNDGAVVVIAQAVVVDRGVAKAGLAAGAFGIAVVGQGLKP